MTTKNRCRQTSKHFFLIERISIESISNDEVIFFIYSYSFFGFNWKNDDEERIRRDNHNGLR